MPRPGQNNDSESPSEITVNGSEALGLVSFVPDRAQIGPPPGLDRRFIPVTSFRGQSVNNPS